MSRSHLTRSVRPRLEILEDRAVPAAGALDAAFYGRGFDVDGKAQVDFSADYRINSMAVQADGKVVMAGFTTSGGGDFAITRMNFDGSLDATFGTDGKVSLSFGGDDGARGVAIQANGKIIVAGTYLHAGGIDWAIARLNTDGSLDTTFDYDGLVTLDWGAGNEQLLGVTVANSKVIVAGYIETQSNTDFAVAQFNEDGSLDTSFSGDGKATVDFGGDDYGLGLAAYSDGRVVIVGRSGNQDFAAARLTATGTLDTSFDGDGKATGNYFGTGGVAEAVAIQADGKIVLGGFSAGDFAVVRLNSDGSVDNSLRRKIDLGSGDDSARDIAIQADGKIVLGGISIVSGQYDFALVRLTPNGNLDTSFSGDGKVTVDMGDADIGWSVGSMADGHVVLGGVSGDNFAAVRLRTDGSLDTDDAAGTAIIPFGPTGSSRAEDVAVQTDGKFLVVGGNDLASASGNDFAVMRLNKDGSRDNTFGVLGKATIDFGNNSTGEQAKAVALQSDGKAVVAGSTYNQATGRGEFAVARLTASGALDTSFGTSGKARFDLGAYAEASDVLIDENGSILVIGTRYAGGAANDFVVIRLTTNGSLDTSFAVNGRATIDLGGADLALAAASQGDALIVVGGAALSNGAFSQFAAIRLDSAGSVDTSFGVGGKRVFNLGGGSNSYASDVAVQADGKIILTGYAASEFGVARLTVDGAFDTSFDTDGMALVDLGGDDSPTGVALASDGKIVLGGHTYNFTTRQHDFAAARLNSNGSADTSFSGDGKAIFDLGGAELVFGLAVQTDQKILLAGSTTAGLGNEKFAVIRIDGGALPPTDITLSGDSLAENMPAGTVVGFLSTSDPNTGDAFTYVMAPLDGENDNASFSVSGGVLTALTPLDHEAGATRTVRVRVTDSAGFTFEKSLTVNVTDINEVTGFDVQNGQTQRSFVRNLDLVFEDTTTLASLASPSSGRVRLTRYALDGSGPGVAVALAGVMSASGGTLKFDFGTQGIGGNRNTNAGDGYYVLEVDTDGDGAFDTARRFYRLFGDVNGSRNVNSADANAILAAFGTSSPERDVNGDGLVNALDRTFALWNNGKALGSSLAIDD